MHIGTVNIMKICEMTGTTSLRRDMVFVAINFKGQPIQWSRNLLKFPSDMIVFVAVKKNETNLATTQYLIK